MKAVATVIFLTVLFFSGLAASMAMISLVGNIKPNVIVFMILTFAYIPLFGFVVWVIGQKYRAWQPYQKWLVTMCGLVLLGLCWLAICTPMPW